MIALSQEVDVVWRRKWSIMTLVYAGGRYSMVIDNILLLIPIQGFVVRRHWLQQSYYAV